MKKKSNSILWNFKNSKCATPFGRWLVVSLPHFEQLLFLEHLNRSSLSKVMTI